MNQKEETRKRLEKEIFKSCKRENRNLDNAEISILLQLENERLFEKLTPNLNKIIEESVINDAPKGLVKNEYRR